METLRAKAAEREEEVELASEEKKQALSAVVEELLHLAFDSRRRFAEMQETLVNHKREVETHDLPVAWSPHEWLSLVGVFCLYVVERSN